MSFSSLLLKYPVVNQAIDKSIDFRCNRWLSALEPFNPPSENTDNKELVPATCSGVVDSVGDALFSQSELDFLAYILNNINTLEFANDEKEFSELQQLTEKVNELSFSYYHPQTCKHCKKNKITYLQAQSLGVCGACEFLNTDTYWNFDISKKIDESLVESCPFGSECTIPKTGSCSCENLGTE